MLGLFDVLEDAMQAVADAVAGLVDMVAQWVQDFMDWTERAMNALMDALLHYGVPQSETVELDCGGYVEIDYYVRKPG